MTHYRQRWPRACPTCQGWGVSVRYTDPSPPGIELAQGYQVDVTECADCAGRGLCPRCREPLVIDAEGDERCPTCGWDFACEGDLTDSSTRMDLDGVW